MLDKVAGSKMDLQRQISPAVSLCDMFHDAALHKTLGSNLAANVSPRGDTTQQAEAWIEALQRSTLRKRFFVTEKGLIGMAPPNLAAGDQLVVLYGGRVPFLVRSVGKHYEFVEETYVHGYMFGRAVDDERAGQLKSEIFRLR
jgi:hypothetical protein